MEQFEKVYKEVESKYQRGEKALKADFESLQKVKKVLIDEKKHIRFGDWNAFDIEVNFCIDFGYLPTFFLLCFECTCVADADPD